MSRRDSKYDGQMRAERKAVVVVVVSFASMEVAAEPPNSKVAPASLVGAYRRTPGSPPQNMTVDKGNTCGDEASAAVRKMADNITTVTVLASSVIMNTGKPNAITFASHEAVIANTVIDRDERFTTALRLAVLGSGALMITYNKVERETADWCSDTWAVMLQPK